MSSLSSLIKFSSVLACIAAFGTYFLKPYVLAQLSLHFLETSHVRHHFKMAWWFPDLAEEELKLKDV